MPIAPLLATDDYSAVAEPWRDQLAAARERSGRTQLSAGLAVGSDNNTWSRWETGRGAPDPNKLILVLDLYPELENDDFLLGWAKVKVREARERRAKREAEAASSPPEGPAGRPHFSETAPPPKDATRRSA